MTHFVALIRILLAMLVAAATWRPIAQEALDGFAGIPGAVVAALQGADGAGTGEAEPEGEIEDVPAVVDGEGRESVGPDGFGAEGPGGVVGGGDSIGPDPTGPAPDDDNPAPGPGTELDGQEPTQTVPTATTEVVERPDLLVGPRYDDPVLRWLPEFRAASRETGVSVPLLAGVARVLSAGDPSLARDDGRHGLLGVSSDDLVASGLSQLAWYEPASNAGVAAQTLANLRAASGTWRRAIGRYVAGACDESGRCQEDAVFAILAWHDVYQEWLSAPEDAGLNQLPDGWDPPPISAQDGSAVAIELPPGYAWPTASPTDVPSVTAIATEPAGPTENPSPTEESGETPTASATPSPTPTATGTPTPEGGERRWSTTDGEG